MKTLAMMAALLLVGCSKPAEPAPEVAKLKPAANLVECPACSNGCAKNADTCPKCGYSFAKARYQAALEKQIADAAAAAKAKKDMEEWERAAEHRSIEAELAPVRACEKTAMEATEKVGGKFTRGANGINLLRINLSGTKANIHTLREIDWSRLDYLVWIDLSNTAIDDQAFKEISELVDIGEIDLRGTKCTPNGILWAKQKWPRATILMDK